MVNQFTPRMTGETMSRVRKLLTAGRVTSHDLTVLDCMLFRCRVPGQRSFQVSYSKICRLTHLARATVAKAIARLTRLHLIHKQRTRVRHGWASRVGTNLYSLLTMALTEFTAQTTDKELVKRKRAPLEPFEGSALDRAAAAYRKDQEARLGPAVS